MAQCDVYNNTNQSTRGRTPFLLDVQADVMETLPTRLVCPLRRREDSPSDPIERVHLPVTIDDVEYVVFVTELTAIPSSVLGGVVASLKHRRHEIVAAIDLLITGF